RQKESSGGLPELVRAVLAEQLALISQSPTAESNGCLTSAAQVASNALAFCARSGDSEQLARIAAQPPPDDKQPSLREVLTRLVTEGTTRQAAAATAPAGSIRAEPTARTLR